MNKVKIAVYHSPGVTGKHVRKVLIKVIICHQGKQSLYVKAIWQLIEIHFYFQKMLNKWGTCTQHFYIANNRPMSQPTPAPAPLLQKQAEFLLLPGKGRKPCVWLSASVEDWFLVIIIHFGYCHHSLITYIHHFFAADLFVDLCTKKTSGIREHATPPCYPVSAKNRPPHFRIGSLVIAAYYQRPCGRYHARLGRRRA